MELRSRTPGRARPAASPRAASPRPRAAAPRASPRASPRAASPRPRAASPAPAAKAAAAAKPAPPHFEFGGAPGAAVITLGLPLVCFALVRFCHADGCLSLSPLAAPPPPAAAYASLAGLAAFCGWFVVCLALHCALPGARVPGTLLRDGSRLTYKLNGLRVLAALLALLAAAGWSGHLDPSWPHHHYLELLSGGLAFSAALSLYLYASSFRGAKLLAAGGDTGARVYDFFIGRELNPRLGGVDLKQFCELTPGLIGWGVLNACFAASQWAAEGRVRPSMLLVCAFQWLYIFDALACEPAILTTMDITTDGFGYMLAFGDLVWVPFTYSLQARYLLEHPVELRWWAVAAIVALQVTGYAMFRGANSQKDAFRRDPAAPAVAHLRSMPTQRGTRLLISGWWGLSRHINYFGDWIMAWAWCLPCGFASPIPYFYVIYFGALLLHRAQRDDEACRAKYGRDWDAYCTLVPYRIIPYLY